MTIPVIILYVDDTGDYNQYIPYDSVKSAKDAISDYIDLNGDLNLLHVFLSSEDYDTQKRELEAYGRSHLSANLDVGRMTPGVLRMALK